jgi:hypothetical protein
MASLLLTFTTVTDDVVVGSVVVVSLSLKSLCWCFLSLVSFSSER